MHQKHELHKSVTGDAIKSLQESYSAGLLIWALPGTVPFLRLTETLGYISHLQNVTFVTIISEVFSNPALQPN